LVDILEDVVGWGGPTDSFFEAETFAKRPKDIPEKTILSAYRIKEDVVRFKAEVISTNKKMNKINGMRNRGYLFERSVKKHS
jgi:hypothetical protein